MFVVGIFVDDFVCYFFCLFVLWGWGVFFNDTATPGIYTLSLHDALPISEHLVLMLIMLPSMELGDRVGPVNDSSKQGVGPA